MADTLFKKARRSKALRESRTLLFARTASSVVNRVGSSTSQHGIGARWTTLDEDDVIECQSLAKDSSALVIATISSGDGKEGCNYLVPPDLLNFEV